MPIALNFNSYAKQKPQPQFGQFGLDCLGSVDYEDTRKLAKQDLQVIIKELNIGRKRNICDFGCGSGGPTMALKELFNPDCMVAVDRCDYYKAPDRSIIFKCCDGIKYLEGGEKKFDLIAAQMLSPSVVDDGKLLKAAYNSLSEDGQLLIYSDSWTMEELIQDIKYQGIDYKSCKTFFDRPAVLIDKKELASIRP